MTGRSTGRPANGTPESDLWVAAIRVAVAPPTKRHESSVMAGYWLDRLDPSLAPEVRRRLAVSKRNEYMARLAFRRERARCR